LGVEEHERGTGQEETNLHFNSVNLRKKTSFNGGGIGCRKGGKGERNERSKGAMGEVVSLNLLKTGQ